MKVGLVALLLLSSVPVNAHESQRGYTTQRSCYKETYREEYVPGTKSAPGYVSSYTEVIEVPCKTEKVVSDPIIRRETVVEYDNNDCSDGKIAGALLGGGAGAAMSRGDGRWWAIPLGAVVGGTIGCDLDGG